MHVVFWPSMWILVKLNWANQSSGHELCPMTSVPDVGEGSTREPAISSPKHYLPLDQDDPRFGAVFTFVVCIMKVLLVHDGVKHASSSTVNDESVLGYTV
jgi:hypothetical protein